MFYKIIPDGVGVIVGGVMVKRFSAWSMCLIILGIVLVSVSDRMGNQVELTVLLGIITCLAGVIFSFVAISKQEEGMLKFISLSFFMVFF